MSKDTLYKRLSDELKPYYENSDCCTYIVELRKYKREAIKEIKQLKQQLQQKENIIKEVREKLNTQLAFTSSYQLNYQSAMSVIEEAKQILNKENK